jgi:hypothetical protein
MPPTRIKRSNTPSAVPSSLEDGELAINQSTGILYYRTAAGGVGSVAQGSGGATLSNATPASLGTPSAGVSGAASRSDHVHPIPSYSSLTDIPSTFAPSSHSHVASDVSGVVATNVTGSTGASTVTNIVALTLTQYNAISAPASTTLYIIKAG